MTADAAHVAAVAEAIRNALREWYEGDTCDVAATAAVETLTPLIRAEVAAEIREGYLDGLEHAEGIAKSTPLTEENP